LPGAFSESTRGRERAVTLGDVDDEPETARGRPARDVPAQRSSADTATVMAPSPWIGSPDVPQGRSRWRTALATVVAVVPLLVVAGFPFLFHS